MTKPDTHVTLTDTEFTLQELEDFIYDARKVDGIDHYGLVAVSHEYDNNMCTYTLKSSTSFRAKA